MSLRRGLLLGMNITGFDRHGKQLSILTREGPCLCVHLGMSGRLMLSRVLDPPGDSHAHCWWHLGTDHGDLMMAFVDPRRFGGLWTAPSVEDLKSRRWGSLGPDALEIDPRTLQSRIAGRSKGIKTALMDQSIIAGLGNIYVDEILHESRLNPRQPAGSLRATEIDRLSRCTVDQLTRAIEQGGSTVRSWMDPEGSTGDFVKSHRVYGRGGQMCMSCGQRLSTSVIGQRTTVWCSRCQGFKRRKG